MPLFLVSGSFQLRASDLGGSASSFQKVLGHAQSIFLPWSAAEFRAFQASEFYSSGCHVLLFFHSVPNIIATLATLQVRFVLLLY